MLESDTTTAAAQLKSRPVPLLDLKAQYAAIREELRAAIDRVADSQHFILGPEVEALEREVAAYSQCEFGIGVSSGTDALLVALMAIGLKPGDEVITTPYTFFATSGAVARLGGKSVFVDIDPLTYNIDPSALEAAVTDQTRAIIPVHLYGQMADMTPLMEVANRHGLYVIEDAAQAIGSEQEGRRAGSIGHFGCFSFFPSKNLGGAGDGGMVTTNDANLAEQLKLLHIHGSRERYVYEMVGMNSRLDALQAAILRVKLRHLAVWNAARRRNAERYGKLFGEFRLGDAVSLPHEPPQFTHVYNQFTIRVKNRDALRQKLLAHSIPTEVYYPIPLHVQKAFQYLGHKAGDFPVSESTSREVLSLPIYPELTVERQRAVVAAIADSSRLSSNCPCD